MARIKLSLPAHFNFSTQIKIRISDLNYGNHLSNDVYLAFMHEARMQFFNWLGYSEMDLAGTSVIMGDTALVYKGECFYGDELKIEVAAAEFGSRSFDLYYRMTKIANNQLVCEAKTGMVCFDYHTRKTTEVPEAFINKALNKF
ncbi:MAG: thioesterase family protein [Bacteroidia bacterium]|nr:thioesterase family protein [Bacteroidia bacterium]